MMNCGDRLVINVTGWDPVTLRCEREAGHGGPHHAGTSTWTRAPVLQAGSWGNFGGGIEGI